MKSKFIEIPIFKEIWNEGVVINQPFRKHFFKVLCLGITAILALSYNNCGKVNVSDIEESASSKVGEQGLTDPQHLISTCQEAKALGKIRVARISSSFPDPKKQCAWGANGNLNPINGLVQARTEQIQNVQVPEKAVVCHIKMESTLVSRFYYDDNVILTLNGFILASTSNFSRHFENHRGFSLYDWNRLIGKPAQNSAEETAPSRQYCAGAKEGVSFCQFPKTETNGTAQLSFGESTIQSILGMTNARQVTLGVITTGDNDSTDCQHVPIDLNLDIEYIQQ